LDGSGLFGGSDFLDESDFSDASDLPPESDLESDEDDSVFWEEEDFDSGFDDPLPEVDEELLDEFVFL
jgi:hypothetical protein